jgi:hypothetical protein
VRLNQKPPSPPSFRKLQSTYNGCLLHPIALRLQCETLTRSAPAQPDRRSTNGIPPQLLYDTGRHHPQNRNNSAFNHGTEPARHRPNSLTRAPRVLRRRHRQSYRTIARQPCLMAPQTRIGPVARRSHHRGDHKRNTVTFRMSPIGAIHPGADTQS